MTAEMTDVLASLARLRPTAEIYTYGVASEQELVIARSCRARRPP